MLLSFPNNHGTLKQKQEEFDIPFQLDTQLSNSNSNCSIYLDQSNDNEYVTWLL